MFPKNWNIQKVKEEIALLYEEMMNSGKFNELVIKKTPHYKALDSRGNFWIKIEFDNVGNITNAHPLI